MAIDNVEAGRKFAKAARIILAGGDMSQGDSAFWFDYRNMHDICDMFNIVGAFNCDGRHWRLVVGLNDDGSMEIYEPLYGNKEGVQIYTFMPPEGSVTIPSMPLQKLCRHNPSEIFVEEARLRMLKENGYSLHLPSTFERAKLQHDGHNCGPLVLYAALVADKYTPEFADKPDFMKLTAATGIEIA